MCGRFVSTSPPDEVAKYFDADAPSEAALPANYNVAPTQDVTVVVEEDADHERSLAAHHWGLVPFWAKSPSIGNRMINARSEGIATKNSYRNAIKKKRCLIPADGFYEWAAVPGQKRKQPYFIHRGDEELLAFAGLWEEWTGPDRDGAQRLRSATIITTEANTTMDPIHDRMPVILPPNRWAEWLDPTNHDVASVTGLLVPAPADLLTLRPVGTDVGNVGNNGPSLLDPIDPDRASSAESPSP